MDGATFRPTLKLPALAHNSWGAKGSMGVDF